MKISEKLTVSNLTVEESASIQGGSAILAAIGPVIIVIAGQVGANMAQEHSDK